MRILLLCHSFNSLTQRLFVELREMGEEVSVEFDISDDILRETVKLFRPDLILASFLRRAIPPDVLRETLCLVVHPGPPGDRGPSALDWAILERRESWGVTLLEAIDELDAGAVWASRAFPMRAATKSSLYRNEVTRGAVACMFEALERIRAGERPSPPPPLQPLKPFCSRAMRAIDFRCDNAATVLRKIRSGDGSPGAMAEIAGRRLLCFDAREARDVPRGAPGDIVARSGKAIAVATRDGAVWIGCLRDIPAASLKLPASLFLANEAATAPERPGYSNIAYEQVGDIGYLHFDFYNGAMSVVDCRALEAAIQAARQHKTRALVLAGGPDYWSNGLHLGMIEAAASAADESWSNINAMNDCVRALLDIDDRLVVSFIRGNAGAGGVFLALAADLVLMRRGVVLNPHYKDMGNLYGSEYWTYLLPRRVGADAARKITQGRLPIGVDEALRLKLIDAALPEPPGEAKDAARAMVETLVAGPDFSGQMEEKRARRARDEAQKPLEAYRSQELERMRRNFWGFDPSYHVARHNFIRKVAKSRTPLHLAVHRSLPERIP
ncbi:enoyl-CoA hydratase-related protein [Rhodoblastus sp.]|uniref:enoyl-CoA hydratase-related protein n=1 Tax=Rhodoblastus sp. TaxID=1962975 RepID=UPI002624B76B|nr:enoyl-CoA hydratase-related protein [Rhodoblastus sp.]